MPSSVRPTGALLALAGFVAAPLPAQQGPWALVNARIETVTRGVIDRGTILIRDGLITAVGPSVVVPPDARVVDLNGRTVSPGLIDLLSSAGLPSPTPAGAGAGGGGGGPGGFGQRGTPPEPEKLVADEIRLAPADARALRASGVTAVLVAPARGLFRGQSALVPTRDSAGGSDVIRSPVAQHLGYQGVGGGEYPGSLLGVITTQRQYFYDAKRYGVLADRWRTNPKGMTRPERDPKLEALVPAARGEQPVWVDARNENEIRRAARLAAEFGLRLTVAGATEAWRASDALKGHGVVVSVDFPNANQVTGWRFRTGLPRAPGDSAAATTAAQRVIEGNAAALHRAGIPFALASGGRPDNLLANVRKAVAAGLPAEVALESLTRRAAELSGMGDALGSIEPGKIANLVVSTGPLLADTSRVTAVFVDGTQYAVDPTRRQGGNVGGGGAGGGGPAPVGGTWSITTNSPQGVMESVLAVEQQGSSFSGTMSTDMFGAQAVSDGQVTGRRVSWSLALSFGGQSFTLSYAGQIDGTRMSGTVTAGDFGSFPFTGEKRP